jgi:hypothetical protein
MADETQKGTRRNIDPDEILREFRWRYRIARNLKLTACFWIVVGGLLYIFGILAGHDHAYTAGFAVFMIGLALMSAASAIGWAILHCPICDEYTNGFGKPLVCKRCSAILR